MGFRYVLALNVPRDIADRADAEGITSRVRAILSQQGFAIQGPVVSKHSIESVIGRARSNILVALNVPSVTTLTAGQTRAVDSAVVQAINESVSADWNVGQTVNGLPNVGNGSYSPNWFLGDITDIQRDVATGDGVPVATITNPTSRTVVRETNDTRLTPGTVTPSGLAVAGEAAKASLAEYKTPLIIGGVVVGLVATAVIVVKVSK